MAGVPAIARTVIDRRQSDPSQLQSLSFSSFIELAQKVGATRAWES